MENHRLNDKDLLALLHKVIRNGDLFDLIDPLSGFQSYEDIDQGIITLRDDLNAIDLDGDRYVITEFGIIWQNMIWRRYRIKGIYRYIVAKPQSIGIQKDKDDPFLPKIKKSSRKG